MGGAGLSLREGSLSSMIGLARRPFPFRFLFLRTGEPRQPEYEGWIKSMGKRMVLALWLSITGCFWGQLCRALPQPLHDAIVICSTIYGDRSSYVGYHDNCTYSSDVSAVSATPLPLTRHKSGIGYVRNYRVHPRLGQDKAYVVLVPRLLTERIQFQHDMIVKEVEQRMIVKLDSEINVGSLVISVKLDPQQRRT